MLHQVAERATILNGIVRTAIGDAKGSSGGQVTKKMILAAWQAFCRPILPHVVVCLCECADGFFWNALFAASRH